MAGCAITIDETKVLHPFKRTAKIKGQVYTVVPSNDMKVIMGYNMVGKVDAIIDADEGPLQGDSKKGLSDEL